MEDTKEKIIDAAAEAFSRNGYHQTKIKDIAHMASVAKGTVYYNFSSKAILFAEVVIKGINIVIQRTREEIDKKMIAEEKLKIIIKTTLDIYLEYENISQILINELVSGIDNKAIQKIKSAKKDYLNLISKIIKEGHKKNEFKNIDPNLTAQALTGFMENSLNHYYNSKEKQKNSKKEIYNVVLEIFLNGLKQK